MLNVIKVKLYLSFYDMVKKYIPKNRIQLISTHLLLKKYVTINSFYNK